MSHVFYMIKRSRMEIKTKINQYWNLINKDMSYSISCIVVKKKISILTLWISLNVTFSSNAEGFKSILSWNVWSLLILIQEIEIKML